MYHACINIVRRSEPSFLVKLVIIGKESFRHDTKDTTMLENDTTIEQQIAIWHRSTYDANDVELLGVVKLMYDSVFSSHKEGLLGIEILTRIA